MNPMQSTNELTVTCVRFWSRRSRSNATGNKVESRSALIHAFRSCLELARNEITAAEVVVTSKPEVPIGAATSSVKVAPFMSIRLSSVVAFSSPKTSRHVDRLTTKREHQFVAPSRISSQPEWRGLPSYAPQAGRDRACCANGKLLSMNMSVPRVS